MDRFDYVSYLKTQTKLEPRFSVRHMEDFRWMDGTGVARRLWICCMRRIRIATWRRFPLRAGLGRGGTSAGGMCRSGISLGWCLCVGIALACWRANGVSGRLGIGGNRPVNFRVARDPGSIPRDSSSVIHPVPTGGNCEREEPFELLE